MKEKIIRSTINALSEINNPRLFKTERGYQGEFYCQLKRELTTNGLLSGDRMLEMEPQKVNSRHHTRQRPDIILHIPIEISGANPDENNFAVWELKLDGKSTDAIYEINNFEYMFRELKYSLAIFINIDSDNNFKDKFEQHLNNDVIALAVKLFDGIPRIYK